MDRFEAQRLLEAARGSSAGADTLAIVQSIVVPALENLGQRWEQGQLALSQIYMGGRICEELVDRFLPPASPHRKNQPRTAIALLEDYHMLGKRIVFSALRASGLELADYGRMDAESLVQRVVIDRTQVLLISALMLNAALRVREVRAMLERANVPVKIVVGGAPFRLDPELWKEVGADGTSPTATGGIAIVNQVLDGVS